MTDHTGRLPAAVQAVLADGHVAHPAVAETRGIVGAVARAAPDKNNFGALRLLAALMVILGHGQDMKGFIPPILWNFPVSRIGLDIFFCISGYLIYDSWVRDPRLGTYLSKRALRIFPALIVCVLITIFVIGPVATILPVSRYFRHHLTWDYLLNIGLYLQLYLPGVFVDRRLGGAVNGSLWSLFPEVLCYLSVPLICLLKVRLRVVLLLLVMALCGGYGLYLFAYQPSRYGLVYSVDPKYMLVQVPFFMAGAVMRQVELWFPRVLRLDFAVIFCASNFLLPSMIGTHSVPFEWLTLAYVVIAFGNCSTPLLKHATMFGDLSYGVYLYAFPIQQLVLEHTHAFALSICTAISFVVAFVSWHLIEQPALRLKSKRAPLDVRRIRVSS
jgi:peptidoglycan/LPS O-acetylase OafA/YrhL